MECAWSLEIMKSNSDRDTHMATTSADQEKWPDTRWDNDTVGHRERGKDCVDLMSDPGGNQIINHKEWKHYNTKDDTHQSTPDDSIDFISDAGESESQSIHYSAAAANISSSYTHSTHVPMFVFPSISGYGENSPAQEQVEKDDKATNVNWSELGPNVLWQRHFFNTVGRLFWEDFDLNTGDETEYKVRISMNLRAIRNELHYICRMGYTRRLRVLCEVISRPLRNNLAAPSMCGCQFGETALHTALMFGQIAVAEILLEFGGPKLVMKQYDHPLYAGMTALHLAVVKGQTSIIKSMMTILEDTDRHALLHTQATGWFLRQNFHASGLPLTLAAWAGHRGIVEELIQFGAEPDRQELGTGNNMLHSLVEYSLYEPEAACQIFQALLEDPCVIRKLGHLIGKNDEEHSEADSAFLKNRLVKQENALGFTPLTLACRLGAMEMVCFILNLKNIYRYPQWEYGPAVMEYFDVSELSSFVSDKRISGLELITYGCGSSCDKMWIYSKQPIKRLMDVFWTAYRQWFLFLGAYHTITMIIFTVCALQWPDKTGLHGGSLRCGEVFVFVYVAIMLGQDIVAFFFNTRRFLWHEMHRGNDTIYQRPWSACRGFRILMVCFCFVTMAWFLARFLLPDYSSMIAAPALLLGWYYTMFFTRLFRDIGIFTSMLNRMVYSDLIYFFFAYGLVVIAFSGAFSCLVQRGAGADVPPEFVTVWTTCWSLLRFTVGLSDLDEHMDKLQSPFLARGILFFFIVISIVLLLNVLIAAMGDTYADIAGKKDDLWRKLKYEAVLAIEKRLPRVMRPKIQLKRHTTYDASGTPQLMWLLQVETVRQNLAYRFDQNPTPPV